MTRPFEQPLPGMPEPPTLWAVHVQGPDDVIAAADRGEAERRAAEINAVAAAVAARPDASPNDPKVYAVVIEWPYVRDEHAEEVARGDQRWEW
ncbi:MAG TPA: hypothetical protein VFC00_06030 [Micromonosporaceae bacterium]|nr:hypothetical protein [Micromonosporaceae bacterium]